MQQESCRTIVIVAIREEVFWGTNFWKTEGWRENHPFSTDAFVRKEETNSYA